MGLFLCCRPTFFPVPRGPRTHRVDRPSALHAGVPLPCGARLSGSSSSRVKGGQRSGMRASAATPSATLAGHRIWPGPRSRVWSIKGTSSALWPQDRLVVCSSGYREGRERVELAGVAFFATRSPQPRSVPHAEPCALVWAPCGYLCDLRWPLRRCAIDGARRILRRH
jgi:hypothetical protein